MQSVGFAYAMDPALRRLYPDAGELRASRGRQLEFFNTHPYLAAAVLGCIARLEQEGGKDLEERVRRVKNALMGAYGAIGDSFYWGGLRPALLLACVIAAFGGAGWAPWLFLCLFGAANVGGRMYFFVQGYRKGLGVVDAVNRLGLLEATRFAKAGAALLLGVLLAATMGPARFGIWGGVSAWTWAVGTWLLTLALSWVIARGLNPAWLVYFAALTAAGIAAWT